MQQQQQQTETKNKTTTPPGYDFHHGEADLWEKDLWQIGRRYTAGLVTFLLVLMIGGLTVALAPALLNNLPEMLFSAGEPHTPTSRPPTLALPTVTPAPPTMTPTDTATPTPTATPTFTPEPCIQTVQAGEGLYAVASRCGHLSFDVLDLIVELNDLADVNAAQPGQTLIIPWPTETPDPAAAPAEPPTEDNEAGTSNGDTASDDTEVSQVSAFDQDFDPLFIPTATLRPGIQFHQVQPDENIIIIASIYGADIEILSQLNPEITFSQCDFGQQFGGPRCTVTLQQGQLVRVPAPTATPTLPPTASGSETPTPTATATFNAPSAQSPSDRALFLRDELITLRWIPSGTLGEGQTYAVRVEDLTAGIVYTAQTDDIAFVLPVEWQGTDGQRHEYSWTVSVTDIANPNNMYFTTDERTFIWEGREPS